MGEEAASAERGIPQLVMSNTLVLNGALFLGILALHTLLEDSTSNTNWVSVALLALSLIHISDASRLTRTSYAVFRLER